MASKRGGVSLPDRRGSKNGDNKSIISRLSHSSIVCRGKQAAGDAAFVSRKLLKSTGKAAWIAGTSFLILVVPLIIAMDREQQMNELELQQVQGGKKKECEAYQRKLAKLVSESEMQKRFQVLLRHGSE